MRSKTHIQSYRRGQWSWWIVFGGIVAQLGSVHADETLHARVFEEYFSPIVKTRGAVLAGLTLGSTSGPLILSRLRMPLPIRTRKSMICLTGHTVDGQYWLREEFDVPTGPAFIVVGDGRSEHSAELEQYGLVDFAVVAEVKTTCDDLAAGYFVPALFDATFPSVLHVAINSQRSTNVTAALLQGSEKVAEGRCEKVLAKRRTAFDTLCHLDLSNSPRTESMRLLIGMVSRAGDRVNLDYILRLPNKM